MTSSSKNPLPGFESLKVTRKRASTLSPEMELPAPESSLEGYTLERVRQGLNFAEARLSRKPTPNTEKTLTLYKAACVDAIAEMVDTETISQERLDEIREYELSMSKTQHIAEVPSSAEDDLDNHLIHLRRYTLSARYGDYAIVLCRKLRSRGVDATVENWGLVPAKFNWLDISSRIRSEEKTWSASGSRFPDRVKTTLEVYEACGRIGIDHATMIEIIHLYANRNTSFHRGLTEALEGKMYNKVGTWIYEDLRDLSSLVPKAWIQQELPMRAAIEALKYEWHDDEVPDQPSSWSPKTALRKYCQDLKKDKTKAERILAESVAKRAAASWDPAHRCVTRSHGIA